MKFRPERWIDNPDLPLNAFGFGRRVCTGQYLSANSMFIIVARLLWTFNFKHEIENGQEVAIDDMAFTSGFNSRPLAFKVQFEPRSSHARAVVNNEWSAANKDIDSILDSIRAALSK
jgi:hypothetical protein